MLKGFGKWKCACDTNTTLATWWSLSPHCPYLYLLSIPVTVATPIPPVPTPPPHLIASAKQSFYVPLCCPSHSDIYDMIDTWAMCPQTPFPLTIFNLYLWFINLPSFRPWNWRGKLKYGWEKRISKEKIIRFTKWIKTEIRTYDVERPLAQLGHSLLSSVCVPGTEGGQEGGREEGRKRKRQKVKQADSSWKQFLDSE